MEKLILNEKEGLDMCATLGVDLKACLDFCAHENNATKTKTQMMKYIWESDKDLNFKLFCIYAMGKVSVMAEMRAVQEVEGKIMKKLKKVLKSCGADADFEIRSFKEGRTHGK